MRAEKFEPTFEMLKLETVVGGSYDGGGYCICVSGKCVSKWVNEPPIAASDGGGGGGILANEPDSEDKSTTTTTATATVVIATIARGSIGGGDELATACLKLPLALPNEP